LNFVERQKQLVGNLRGGTPASVGGVCLCFHYAPKIRQPLAYASEKITFFKNIFAPC
jgi:hypothetical protein